MHRQNDGAFTRARTEQGAANVRVDEPGRACYTAVVPGKIRSDRRTQNFILSF